MIHVAVLPLHTCFRCLSSIVCNFMSNCYFCILVIPIKHCKCWIISVTTIVIIYLWFIFKRKDLLFDMFIQNYICNFPHKHVEYCRQCQRIIVRYWYGNNSPWNSQMGYCYKRFHSTNFMWFHCMWLFLMCLTAMQIDNLPTE